MKTLKTQNLFAAALVCALAFITSGEATKQLEWGRAFMPDPLRPAEPVLALDDSTL